MDALRQRLLQHRRDRDRIVGGEQDAVDAAGDVVVDELDLFVDLGFGRAVGLRLDVAEFLGGVGDALRGRVEVADADQLRHVDHRDLLAGLVGRVDRLAAVIGLGRRGRRGGPTASERRGRQIVGAVPCGGAGAAPRGRGPPPPPSSQVFRSYSIPPLLRRPVGGLSSPNPAYTRRRWRELAISTEAMSTTPITMIVASPFTPVSAKPFFSN